jgi:hypothetical protein
MNPAWVNEARAVELAPADSQTLNIRILWSSVTGREGFFERCLLRRWNTPKKSGSTFGKFQMYEAAKSLLSLRVVKAIELLQGKCTPNNCPWGVGRIRRAFRLHPWTLQFSEWGSPGNGRERFLIIPRCYSAGFLWSGAEHFKASEHNFESYSNFELATWRRSYEWNPFNEATICLPSEIFKGSFRFHECWFAEKIPQTDSWYKISIGRIQNERTTKLPPHESRNSLERAFNNFSNFGGK